MFYWFVRWQNNLRDLMGVERIGYDVIPEIIGVAVVVFLLLMFIGKLWGGDPLGRAHLGKLIPARIATVAGAGRRGVDRRAGQRRPRRQHHESPEQQLRGSQQRDKADVSPPTSPLRSGGPGSTVSWDSLGREGRSNVADGPTVADLTAFNGTPAKEPIPHFRRAGLGGRPEGHRRGRRP